MQTIHITDFLSEAWAIFKKNPGLAIGGFVLYMVITIVGNYIPILGFFFAAFVGPALTGGYIYFFLKFAKEDNPEINNLFEGFNRYGTLLGLYWLMVLAILVCMLPTIILGLILMAIEGYILIPVIGLANLIAVIYFLIRYSLVYFVIMDDRFVGVFDALKRSERLTQGYRGEIFLFALLMIAIGIISFLLLLLPYLIAGPLLGIAWGRFYLRLKAINGGAEVVTPVTPSTPPPPPTMAAPESQTENTSQPPTMPPPEDTAPPDEGETK
ncbi:MAG: DUF975 family protein [Candidatus Zixiibacteriota bacterium]